MQVELIVKDEGRANEGLNEVVSNQNPCVGSNMMIVVDTCGEVNPKETKAQLTTTAGALDMRGFD